MPLCCIKIEGISLSPILNIHNCCIPGLRIQVHDRTWQSKMMSERTCRLNLIFIVDKYKVVGAAVMKSQGFEE